jgi:3-oxoacyl-[acyl-carrier protein] reductase
MPLNNKIALVTGGARDIGKAIAMQLASAGARVIVHYWCSGREAENTISEIRRAGGEAVSCCADLTKNDDVLKIKDFCISTYGESLDILINNSGGLIARKKLEEQDEGFYNAVMDVNFKSLFLVTRAFVKLLPPGAAIVNISSLAARDGGGGGSSLYAASKGAITTYTRSLAKELGPLGIRVNSVCPGMINTSFHDIFTAGEIRTRVAAATPLGREGSAGEVADLVCFLASEKASFITGVNYDINGGLGFS